MQVTTNEVRCEDTRDSGKCSEDKDRMVQTMTVKYKLVNGSAFFLFKLLFIF